MKKSYLSSDRIALLAAVRRGESVRAAAERLGIGISTAYQWSRESTIANTRNETSPRFVEMVSSAVMPSTTLVVHVGAVDIEVRPGFDPALLRAIVSALAVPA